MTMKYYELKNILGVSVSSWYILHLLPSGTGLHPLIWRLQSRVQSLKGRSGYILKFAVTVSHWVLLTVHVQFRCLAPAGVYQVTFIQPCFLGTWRRTGISIVPLTVFSNLLLKFQKSCVLLLSCWNYWYVIVHIGSSDIRSIIFSKHGLWSKYVLSLEFYMLATEWAKPKQTDKT